jgi:hypothetical protein
MFTDWQLDPATELTNRTVRRTDDQRAIASGSLSGVLPDPI